MLRALGDYRDMSAFEQALPSENFSRLEIPLGRLGKRVYGFMSIREPLPDDRDHRQDVPHTSLLWLHQVGLHHLSTFLHPLA